MTALGKGTRVKCIEAGWTDLRGDILGPSIGSVWTIDAVLPKGTFDAEYYFWLSRDFLTLVEWSPRWQRFAADNFVSPDGNEDISILLEAAKKGPVEGERDERVRTLEPTR